MASRIRMQQRLNIGSGSGFFKFVFRKRPLLNLYETYMVPNHRFRPCTIRANVYENVTLCIISTYWDSHNYFIFTMAPFFLIPAHFQVLAVRLFLLFLIKVPVFLILKSLRVFLELLKYCS